MEFCGMAKSSSPILDHVVRNYYFLIWRMAYGLAPDRGRIGDEGIHGQGAEIAHAAECLAGPLCGYFEFLYSLTASEFQADVQNCASSCDRRIKGIVQDSARTICREPALSQGRHRRN